MKSFSRVMSIETVPAMKRRAYLAGSILLLLFVGVGLNSLSPSLKLASSALLALVVLIWFAILHRSLARQAALLSAPLAGLLIVQSISLLWTPLPRPASELLLQNVLLFGFFLFVISTVLAGWPSRSWLEAVLLTASALCLVELLLVASWLLNWSSIGSEFSVFPPVGYRASGLLLGHPNVLSGFVNLAVPLVLLQLLQAPSTGDRVGLAGFLGLLLATQYFSSSRTGWIGLAASLLVFGALYALSESANQRGVLRRFTNRISRWGALRWISTLAVLAALAYALFWQITRTGHAPISRARFPVWEASLNIIRQSPILGTGLGSYPTLFTAQGLTLDQESVPHAHNLLLQLNIDSGWPGIAVVGLFVLLLTLVGVRRWKSSAPEGRRTIAAFAAIGAGILTHHLADYLFGPPLYTMAVLAIVGVFIAAAVETESNAPEAPGIPVGPGVGALALVALAGIAWLLGGAWPHWEAAQAARTGEWQTAAAQACRSFALRPAEAAYASSCGVAVEYQRFYTGEGDPDPRAFASAAANDPHWYLHWASLGVHSRIDGDYARAASALDRAIDIAPHSAELALNRGYVEELRGDRAAAAAHYRRAARLDPWVMYSGFVQANEFRRGALQGLRLDRFLNAEQSRLWWAYKALETGSLDLADRLLERALQANPRQARAYALRARYYLQTGDLESAARYAAIADFVRSTDPWVAEAVVEVHAGRGENELARSRLMDAISTLLEDSDSQRYFLAAYRRYSFQVDRHPGTVRADIPAPLVGAAEGLLGGAEVPTMEPAELGWIYHQADPNSGAEWR